MDEKCPRSYACYSHTLTWLPDTLRGGQSVAEDALVPQATEAVYDAPGLIQNGSLHLVLVCV